MNKTAPYQAKTPIRRQVLPIRGLDHSISEWGDENAPLLIYLHGWADTGSTFQFVVDELTQDWHVVAPDWRGFGRTAHSAGTYWFPDYIADLHELLRHFSQDAAVSLVGHSMGGNIASLYAGVMPILVFSQFTCIAHSFCSGYQKQNLIPPLPCRSD